MSLPRAARGLKIPYVVRNDWQSGGLAMAAALTCYKKLAKLASAAATSGDGKKEPAVQRVDPVIKTPSTYRLRCAAWMNRQRTPLTEEDYASVLTAMHTLTGRYRSGLTLNEALARWRLVVTGIEEGFDTQWVWEYHHELACRDWLCEAWPLLTDRVRALRQPFLNEMDDRFAAATAPIQGKEAEGRRNGRWWHDRYPRRVFGQHDDELPPSWSPAPEYIDDN